MVSTAAFADKGLRSDFAPELKRVLAALRDCDSLDKMLGEAIESFMVRGREDPSRSTISLQRGAGSMVVRLTEQRISNRTQRRDLIKLLHSIKKDILDRDFRLAKAEVDADVAEETAATAELLARIQAYLVLQPGSASILEPSIIDAEAVPVDPDEVIRARLGAAPGPAARRPHGEAWPDGLPEDFGEGDTVCDPSGELWVVGPSGAEPAGARAAEVFGEPPDGGPPYARLEDGRLVLVVDVTPHPGGGAAPG